AAGIDINDLSFAASTIDTTDLIITLNAGFDEIEVENQLGTNTAQYIDTLRFADGATASFDLYDGWVFGTASGETLNGGSTKDIILLGAGNDTSNGNDGDDELFGGEGNDTLRGYGDNDILVGGDGTDLLYGGDGNDFLYAGAGNLDRLEGGNGADTFVLAGDDALNGLNRIIDFDGTESDALQLVDVLFGYDPVTSAINDFVTLTESGGNTNLYVDRDGAHETYTAQHVARFEGVTGEWTDAADMLSQGELAVVV
ncbi:MAG: type I secretion C-terminal target domain-containing protein, partial [Lewinella sp.]|nr:type I secretion C-terminal target domain-containing protein [Lewinella sp.]